MGASPQTPLKENKAENLTKKKIDFDNQSGNYKYVKLEEKVPECLIRS